MTRPNSKNLTTPDLVVLGLLSEQPMHGYQVVIELERRDVRDWAGISRPQVYYSLQKLERIGLVKSVRDREPSSGPERHVYAPTRAAKEALAEALAREEWATQRPPPPFVTWAALSPHARPATLVRMVERRRRYLREQIAKEKATLESVRGNQEPIVRVGEAIVRLGVRQFELELGWLDELGEALRAATPRGHSG